MSVSTQHDTSKDQRFALEQQRRIALRRALREHGNDPRLFKALQRLMTPAQVQEAAARGVFISYSRADEVFAFELREALCSAGVPVWLDMVDAEGDWGQAIERAMQTSGLMLAVMSPAALADTHIRAEHEHFLNMGKLVLPVLAAHCDLNRRVYWLRPVDLSRDFKRGMLALRRVLLPEPGVV